ncbi:unnamed protein product [Fraxinus pennsylvanica]|uniref:Uncharacterized protein n=1 Tax=Fraxinus pennsylvanica TaxID=56036 RepID=A0AAD1ZZR2_9LAMI|nr:unnamed protein product [Fraxinus pennsylvanica]
MISAQNPANSSRNPINIPVQGKKVKLGPLKALAGGISYATCGTTYKSNNLMPTSEEPRKEYCTKEVTQMETLSSRVEPTGGIPVGQVQTPRPIQYYTITLVPPFASFVAPLLSIHPPTMPWRVEA